MTALLDGRAEILVGLVVAVPLLGYLVLALVRPERF
ncbi:K(+)-transporting ATPase subunit F [Streptomyces sp. HNM0574]|nr:K(+)-transporting ATPase subunit F [Streptomyces sp. HNM0574]